MGNSNKSTLFTFGNLENLEDAQSEKPTIDSTVEDTINPGKNISTKTIENHQKLVKDMERLNFWDQRPRFTKSSDDSFAALNDSYKRSYEERSLKWDDEMRLPSEIFDKEYIYMPSASEDIDDENINTGGKWMVFLHGDLQQLDQYWLALIALYKNGSLTRLKCSTAMGSNSGVINCYIDSENPADVKKAADCIRECIDYDQIMYFKTNKATALGLYIRFGNKNISKYMHTVKNSLYEKDKLDRWKLVSV